MQPGVFAGPAGNPPGADCVHLLYGGNPGPGFAGAGAGGIPGASHPAGGYGPPHQPRGVCCLDVKGGEVEGLQMPI